MNTRIASPHRLPVDPAETDAHRTIHPGSRTPRRPARWLPLGVGLVFGAQALFAVPRDSDCLLCHEDASLTKTNALGRVISLHVDPAVLRASAHATNTCASCHTDIGDEHPDDGRTAEPVDCARCHLARAESYSESVHGLAWRVGDAAAPVCKDCHGTHHGVLPPHDPASPLHFTKLHRTCGGCHEQEAADVAESVHGRRADRGKPPAATCIDCHSEHRIEPLKAGPSRHIAADVCGKCHASERINTRFRLPRDRVSTFFESYHGLATQLGSTRAANCSSCHGYHRVFPSGDPRSSTHPDNLVSTCGQCHPGASAKFALGPVHVDPRGARHGDLAAQINWWVRHVYLVLIFGLVGAMAVHNGLLFARRLRAHLQGRPRPVLRMNRSQWWQHFVLMTSFFVLAVTGFALKFPESWLAHALGSNEPFRRWAHRIAGVVLLLGGAYHLAYVLFTREGRQLLRDFLPARKDLRDVVDHWHYGLGRRARPPAFGRFGYAEKMEYWAVVWGTVIMGVTGLIIWLKLDVTRVLPRWTVEVATTIHYYEAILACLAIVVWHFYHVIFDPEVYPLNPAVWDGRVSREWMEAAHPSDPRLAEAEPSAEHPLSPSAAPPPRSMPS